MIVLETPFWLLVTVFNEVLIFTGAQRTFPIFLKSIAVRAKRGRGGIGAPCCCRDISNGVVFETISVRNEGRRLSRPSFAGEIF